VKYDFEERTLEFGKRVVRLCRALTCDAVNDRFIRQVVGSSASVGANYREANDALSKKDAVNRMRIARKEAKEVKLHLQLIAEANPRIRGRMGAIIQEAEELKRILSTMIQNLTDVSGN